MSKQAPSLYVLLPLGLWLAVPNTWANRRGVMILLRWLRRANGWPLVTYEQTAQALGYADRRNVHNFWAEFEADSADLAAFLQRRKKVDAEVVARCEQIWQALATTLLLGPSKRASALLRRVVSRRHKRCELGASVPW